MTERRDINFNVTLPGAPWFTSERQGVWKPSQNQDGSAYTISDIQGMKHQHWGQMMRFWTRNPDGGLNMTEGQLGTWRVNQGRRGTTVALELYSVRQVTLDPDAIFELCTDAGAIGPLPVGCVPYGMALIEGGNATDGFTPLVYAGPKNVELESRTTVLAFDGHNAAWTPQERCEVTIDQAGPLAEILRGPNW